MDTPSPNAKRLFSVSKLTEAQKTWLTKGTLRYYIANAAKNGFDKVIVRVGSRVLIDEDLFFQWIKEQNQLAANVSSKNSDEQAVP